MKKVMKIGNLLLTLMLILSWLVFPIFKGDDLQATAAEADAGKIQITNGGFEEELVENNIPGWNRLPVNPASGTSVEPSLEQSFAGSKSLKITDESTSASIGATSEYIAVEGGKVYIASAKTYVAKASVRMYLKFYNSSKKEVSSPTVLSNTLNTWTDAVIEAAAPEDAVWAQIWFYMGAGGVSTAYIDEVNLEKFIPAEGDIKVKYGASVDLGEAVQIPLTQGAAYGLDAEGKNEQYFAINGAPATFYAVNAETGEKNFSKSLPGVDVVWAMAVGPDGNVYFSGTTDGKLYSYNPKEKKVTEYGPIPDHKFIWDIKTSEAGKVYMATYNKGSNGKVCEFDIESKTFRDLGEMKDGAEYVRGLGIDGDYLYAGVGGVKGAVVQYNLLTGEKKDFTVEAPPTMFSDVMVVQDKIIAGTGTTFYVFDKTTFQHINTIKSDGKMVSTPSPYDSNLVYYKANKTELYSYNVTTNESTLIEGIPPLPSTGLKNNTWITLQEGPKAGKTVLVGMGAYTDSFFYDPEDNWFNMIYPNVEAQGVLLQSLEISPEGQLYIGGYQRGASIYDTLTESYLHNIPTFHQPEGIGFMNGKAYFGTYGGAVIYKYDPSLPFNYREDSTGNPGLAYDMEEDQDRPFVIKNSGNKLFIGTFPTYGKLGGALSIYEEDEEGALKEVRVYRNIIENQSITGIAYKDGILYAGSSIEGGLGSTPTASEAKIIMVDEATGKVLKETSLNIPGLSSAVKFISDLSFGADGLLWGSTGTDGTVFALNPDTLEVVKYISLYPGATHNNGFRPFYLRWGQDGLMYTNVNKKLIALDTETMEYKSLIDESVNLFVLDNEGSIYYGSGTKLKKLPILMDSVSISLEKETLALGSKLSLNPKALLSNGVELPMDALSYEYIISDDNVVAINEDILEAKNPGSVDIQLKVTYGKQELLSNKIKVTVVVPVEEVKIIERKTHLKISESYNVKAFVYPENATNKKIIYSSDNPEIASVDSEGIVTAHQKGKAIITAVTEDGSFKDSTEIRVAGTPSNNNK